MKLKVKMHKIFKSITLQVEALLLNLLMMRQMSHTCVIMIPSKLLNYLMRHQLKSKMRSEEHTSELQSRGHLVCRLLLEKKKKETKAQAMREAEGGGETNRQPT